MKVVLIIITILAFYFYITQLIKRIKKDGKYN